MQKIITIGGGTGHFQVLRGLKNYECDITAIVNMSDNGGSSGRLRDEYGVLPPGDARQCLIALAGDRSGLLRRVFSYRLKDGHSLGNLIIAALSDGQINNAEGIEAAGELLQIEGRVYPVTTDSNQLIGKTHDGRILRGEEAVNYPKDPNTRISEVYLEPDAFLYRKAGNAIKEADKIVICPGCLYGSIIPNFLVRGMSNALQNSNAQKIYVCNIVTKEGDFDFKAGDFVREIEKYSGAKMNKIIINTRKYSAGVIEKYFSEHSRLVEDDLSNDERIIRGEFAAEYLSEPKTILRHVPEKIAHIIIGL